MKNSVTQELPFGCGIACFAFATDMSYKQAAKWLGAEQANSQRFWVKNLTTALNQHGLAYKSCHVSRRISSGFKDGTIVLIRRSKRYPVGHYLIKHDGMWMDPWINICDDRSVINAKSGYRERLPGKAMYALVPVGLKF